MKTIFKQIIGHTSGEFKLELPKNSAILSVMSQHDAVVVHYLCDSEETQFFTFKFFMFETGKPLPENSDNLSYLKTVSLLGEDYILHVFVDLNALEEFTKVTEIKES